MRSPYCLYVCVSPPPLYAWTSLYETLILPMYFIDPYQQYVCVYVYPLTVAGQHFSKKVIAATNTHATIEESLEVSPSMGPASYRRKIGVSSSQALLL
jgi:hypothetical protein